MGKFHDLMDREIRIRGFAENTRKSYLRSMRCFVRHFMRAPDELGVEHVKAYQLYMMKERRVAWSTFNVHVCAICFVYRHVLEVDWSVEQIEGPGFALVGISLDEDGIALVDFLEEEDMPWPQVCDLGGFEGELPRLYNVRGIPHTVLVGPDGRIIAGDLRGDELAAAVEKALAATR